MAELVNHPDVQAKVIRSSSNPAEQGGGGGDVQVQAMPYLKAVVLEGLRRDTSCSRTACGPTAATRCLGVRR
jgi:cytochrome P450